MFKSMIRRVSVIISSVLIFFLSASAGTDDDESTIRAILLARFGRLHNVIVDYSVTEHLPIPPDMRPEDVVTETGLLITGTRVRQEQFSLLGDLFFYSYSVQSWEPAVDDPAFSRMRTIDEQTHILTPSRAEWLCAVGALKGEPIYRGQIYHSCDKPSGFLPLMLGLGVREMPTLFTERDIQAMPIERLPDGQVMLRHIAEERQVVYEWFADPKLGYAITRFHGLTQGTATIKWFMEDFREVGGLMLPYKARMQHWWLNGSEGNTTSVTVGEYRLDDPANTPDRYRMRWPEGTHVTDERSDVTFTVRAGKLTYDDDDIAQIALEQLHSQLSDPSGQAADHNDVPDANTAPGADEGLSDSKDPAGAAPGVAGRGPRRWLWAIPAVLLAAVIAAVALRPRARKP